MNILSSFQHLLTFISNIYDMTNAYEAFICVALRSGLPIRGNYSIVCRGLTLSYVFIKGFSIRVLVFCRKCGLSHEDLGRKEILECYKAHLASISLQPLRSEVDR